MELSPQALRAGLASRRETLLRDGFDLLRFPSISADPAHHEDCLRCAAWLRDHLAGMGLHSELLETPSKPVVWATAEGPPGAPRVLFYGHYDVQPVDPLDAWVTPPFEPDLRDGRVYARGAQDDKGQLFYVLKAVETLLAADALPVALTVLIEGEEESGSRGLAACLDTWHDRLAADVLMVADTGMVSSGLGTVVAGLRGLIGTGVRLRGPRHDLHSGLHGGVAPNPANALARLLGSLHHDDGRIAVEGFMEGLRPPTPAEREILDARPPEPPEACLEATGVPPTGGDRSRSVEERRGFLPALDINGLAAGHARGMKTIIPAEAVARLTARLAAGQDPDTCLARLEAHLAARVPEGLTLDLFDRVAAGAGFRVDLDRAPLRAARRVLDRLCGGHAVVWEGASIPIIPALAAVAGADPVLVGFGRDEDCVHAPNESFSLAQFELGYCYTVLMLTELGAGAA